MCLIRGLWCVNLKFISDLKDCCSGIPTVGRMCDCYLGGGSAVYIPTSLSTFFQVGLVRAENLCVLENVGVCMSVGGPFQ